MSILLYEQERFRGPHTHVMGRDEPNLHHGGWGDRALSAQVLRGRWKLCQHADYGGAAVEVGPGSYPDLTTLGLPYRSLSSVLRLDGAGLHGSEGVILFEGPHFRGDHKHVVLRDEPNLHADLWGDRVSSVIVLSGAWIVFAEPGYAGAAARLGPGLYDTLPAAAAGVGDNAISSLRREVPPTGTGGSSTGGTSTVYQEGLVRWDPTTSFEAATGTPPLLLAEAVLFEHAGFGGRHRHLVNRGEADLHADGWGDLVSSLQVVPNASWRLFRHVGFGEPSVLVPPGSHPRVWELGMPNDEVSSIRPFR